MDRINDLEVRDELFKPNPKINPQQNFADAVGVVYSIGDKQKVTLSFTPSQGHYIKSLPLHKSQQVTVDNEKECRVELFIVPNYELIQQILMQHDQVKVLEPEWLANEIKEHLRRALDQY